mmetsp:Transcript_17140/g.15017  ORF Transcript_17140/g.15017 Transcript_17140/m.15017 type:complete len:215 (-) Transcript_17140:104-748(-)
MDLGYNNAGIFVDVVAKSTTGFTLEVTAPLASVVYFVEVSWLATNAPDVEVLKESTDFINKDEYSSNVKVNNDAITDPQVMLFLNGFRFGANQDATIKFTASDITATDFNVNFEQNNLHEVVVSGIIFERKEGRVLFPSEVHPGSPLSTGQDRRVVEHLAPYKSEGLINFFGLSEFSFATGSNFRLNCNVEPQGEGTKVEVVSWWTTKVNSATL